MDAAPHSPELRISAVVPTWNEAENVARSLTSLRRAGIDEIVVVDGHSTDDTVTVATPLADRVLLSSLNLFTQLNRGAAAASGDVLLFHYADGDFPPGGRTAILRTLARGDAVRDGRHDVVGGAFRLSFRSRHAFYRFIAVTANARNRLRLGPFGDQSIFVRRQTFEVVSGFSVDRYLPDLQFVQALRRLGHFALLEDPVVTSDRRWESRGRTRTLFNHWWLTGLYVLGKRRAGSRAEKKSSRLRTVR